MFMTLWLRDPLANFTVLILHLLQDVGQGERRLDQPMTEHVGKRKCVKAASDTLTYCITSHFHHVGVNDREMGFHQDSFHIVVVVEAELVQSPRFHKSSCGQLV